MDTERKGANGVPYLGTVKSEQVVVPVEEPTKSKKRSKRKKKDGVVNP